MRGARSLLCLMALAGCARHDPPGAEPAGGSSLVQADREGSEREQNVTERGEAIAKDVLGTDRDNLPFEPDGSKVASTAWRTWIYSDVGAQRRRYGYLRAGAIVDARGPAIVNDGCAGGWWRINPRGFVCVGKGATLDLNHPIVKASSVRPVRGQALPYVYARAGEVAPLFYFRLATLSEMEKVEGEGIAARAKSWKQMARETGLSQVIGEPGPPPDFLSPVAAIEKPYGVTQRLHLSVHSGRSAPDAGFAIQRVFEWQERIFGLSTELDLIALDRTKVVRPSTFHGIELGSDEGLPVAFIEQRYAQRYKLVGKELVAAGSFAWREGVKLTGATRGSYYETRDGTWMTSEGARIIAKRDSFPSFATGDRKWIDLSIRDQTLVAYVGEKPVYATLVSTGRGGLGDPEKTPATARGTFMVYSKHVSATMDGEEDKADSYFLLDVPFVQYFHKGYALHGTYWHDEFGKVRSHGCVNMSPVDSAWIFEWTDPPVPPGWHGVLNKERGTVVFVRP